MDPKYKRQHVFFELITNSLGFTNPNHQNIKMKLAMVLILLNAFATIDAFRPKRSRFLRFHRHNDATNDEQTNDEQTNDEQSNDEQNRGFEGFARLPRCGGLPLFFQNVTTFVGMLKLKTDLLDLRT